MVAAAATAAVSLASPTASFAAGTPSASSGADAGKPSQAQWKKLGEVTKKYDPLGVFGGASQESQQVVGLPAGTSAAEKSKLSAEIPAGMDVTVKISQFTKDGLKKIEKTVLARKWHADADKYAIGFAYDAKQDKLKVDTDAPASVTQSLLDANPGKIAVQQARFEVQRSRFNDYAPFSGGAAFTNVTWGDWAKCTAGVSVKNPYTLARKMTIAGHCADGGNTLLHRYADGHTGPYFGSVEAEQADIDTALVGGSNYGGHIWTGGYTESTSFMGVSGGNNPWNGASVCVSGWVTMNHCGHPVTNQNYTFSTLSNNGTNVLGGNGFTYDQGGSWQPWGWQWGRATEPGDSGAPVFYPDQYNASATIVGTHSARIQSGECGCWRMIGVRIGATLSTWRLDLVRHWE